ncbi:MAG: four helix bundle protein [Bacteroidota bacterium]
MSNRTSQYQEKIVKFGLTSQIRRSAVSIPSNIAEGARRNSDSEFRHFLGIASGSGGELYTQLLLAARLGFIEEKDLKSIIETVESINRMNSKLIQSLSK